MQWYVLHQDISNDKVLINGFLTRQVAVTWDGKRKIGELANLVILHHLLSKSASVGPTLKYYRVNT